MPYKLRKYNPKHFKTVCEWMCVCVYTVCVCMYTVCVCVCVCMCVCVCVCVCVYAKLDLQDYTQNSLILEKKKKKPV